MHTTNFNVPILFLIFNQPDITLQTFIEIKKVKPKTLYISADGPRLNKPGEENECFITRKIILDLIDWDCDVHTRFLENNLGCKKAVSSGISWFLNEINEGIILEYDCVPSRSFFSFCEVMLTKFRNDSRIMAISGSNYQLNNFRGDSSYYFSKIPSAWGWATWKRSWDLWDGDIESYPQFDKEKVINSIFKNSNVRDYWKLKFDQVYNKIDTTWGYPWVYAVFKENGLCVTPNLNLITNIGFSQKATNAVDEESSFANTERFELSEITHPKFVVPNIEADEFFSRRLAYIKPTERIFLYSKRLLNIVLPSFLYSYIKIVYRKYNKQ